MNVCGETPNWAAITISSRHDQQHRLAGPLSPRQPELIPTSHLSHRLTVKHRLEPSCQASAGTTHRPGQPGLHTVAELSSMRSRRRALRTAGRARLPLRVRRPGISLDAQWRCLVVDAEPGLLDHGKRAMWSSISTPET